MNRATLLPLLIGLAILVALPTIGCVCYYAFIDFGNGGALAVPVVLAYPTMLIGAIGCGAQLLSSHRSRVKTFGPSCCSLPRDGDARKCRR